MHYITRKDILTDLFPNEKKYRVEQLERALFNVGYKSWLDVSSLPLMVRQKIQDKIPWTTFHQTKILESKDHSAYKAILTCADNNMIETVMMRNARRYWTICLSAQIGCAMSCAFCATGKMGFIRNLTSDEIIDQYRFWKIFLHQNEMTVNSITNIVFMGMGEPLENYENVKYAIERILKYTNIGMTKITVSTVGLLPNLEKILEDNTWPDVRIALSLHSAHPDTRKKIVPSTSQNYLSRLATWIENYGKKYGNRQHYITLEYVMLKDVNDSLRDAQLLQRFAAKLGRIRINLIPYNSTNSQFTETSPEHINKFFLYLKKNGIDVTVRRSYGQDINAACGQLIALNKKTLV